MIDLDTYKDIDVSLITEKSIEESLKKTDLDFKTFLLCLEFFKKYPQMLHSYKMSIWYKCTDFLHCEAFNKLSQKLDRFNEFEICKAKNIAEME